MGWYQRPWNFSLPSSPHHPQDIHKPHHGENTNKELTASSKSPLDTCFLPPPPPPLDFLLIYFLRYIFTLIMSMKCSIQQKLKWSITHTAQTAFAHTETVKEKGTYPCEPNSKCRMFQAMMGVYHQLYSTLLLVSLKLKCSESLGEPWRSIAMHSLAFMYLFKLPMNDGASL